MDRLCSEIGVSRLVNEILARYDSVDAFCAHLRRLLDEPTVELPPVPAVSVPGPGGRHRRGTA
ncbi:hypothetical protein [Nocardia sp. NPDC050435]|uniref:hypothetical protein n=1 Tax=Nocardia sp. NPDC050435 TaxID=3155040 RepID=UPI0033DFD700